MFKKILIANRGEISLRVLRACKELGVKTVAVYSEADRNSLPVALADESYCIGPSPAAGSYLNMEAVLSAAAVSKSEAVHPGYGFLAENSSFAKKCKDWKIVFIGPSPEAIRRLGDKAAARKLAKSIGVPTVPGTEGCVSGNYKREAAKVGYPLMIKAAGGGGGKGLRIVRSPKLLEKEIHSARREAAGAFGDSSIYLERYLKNPRHIEIQIAADSRGQAVAFPERDCSIQRRHQKLIEESPSPAVDPGLRGRLMDAALKLVRAAGYTGLGTAEFLVDKDGNFYFIEVNTRLQVEHPVTEAVTGLDLVQEQIRIAAGEPLSFSQEQAQRILSHAIELRINAEDPSKGFAPSPGKVSQWIAPGGIGVRVDSHLYPGYEIPTYYDSLIAKLICFAGKGESRLMALSRARRALDEWTVEGISTTIPFHQEMLQNPDFIKGRFDTQFLERRLTHERENSLMP